LLIKVIQLCDEFEEDYNCSDFIYFRLTQGSEFIISRQSNDSCVPFAEVNLGILNVSFEGTRNLDFIADSIDRRQICGMLRAIANNIKGG